MVGNSRVLRDRVGPLGLLEEAVVEIDTHDETVQGGGEMVANVRAQRESRERERREEKTWTKARATPPGRPEWRGRGRGVCKKASSGL